MKILLSNDDGFSAAGIVALHQAVSQVADVTVVAPNRNRSGTGSGLTLDRALEVRQEANGFTSVDGTPADCVMLAITDLLPADPDLVISGINNGANLGDDVLYSGTVGAAMEGRVLGVCCIAVSLACAHNLPDSETMGNFKTAAKVAVELIHRLGDFSLEEHTILNINVPDLPYDRIDGWEVTRLGSRGQSAPAIPEFRESGHPLWRIGPAGESLDDGPGTDFNAVNNGRVSITPLRVDRTATEQLAVLERWLVQPEDRSGSRQESI